MARKTEAQILVEVQLATSKFKHVRLFRNNVGQFITADGRRIAYGVGGPGGSDLIGYRTLEITPDMVGQRIAQFISCEVKSEIGRISDAQINFTRVVNEAGGLGVVVTSSAEAENFCRTRQILAE